MTFDPLPIVVNRPFPGLRAFRASEAHLYFGRDGQSDSIIRKMAESRFIAVVGASGGGKSSLVRAGLLPALYAGRFLAAGSKWSVVDFRPGRDPIGALADALAPFGDSTGGLEEELMTSPGCLGEFFAAARDARRLTPDEHVLVLVDQFEEIFRYKESGSSEDRDRKTQFVRLLTDAASGPDKRIYILITLRADFLGDCAQYRDLPESINRGQYLVPRMTRRQNQAAIERPIRLAGASIAPRLVQRLLNELGEEMDRLPVLQHALMRTWDAWSARQVPKELIDFVDYEAIGGLELALSIHADEVAQRAVEGVTDGAAAVMRIFQALRERDANNREVRRPVSVRVLQGVSATSSADCRKILDAFRDDLAGATFLTPLQTDQPAIDDDTEIDITHEALLRQWKALADQWAPEEEESRRIYTRLAQRAEEDRGTENVLKETALDSALQWWQRRKPTQAWADRYHPGFAEAADYLDRSCKRRAQKQKEKDDEFIRQERQRMDEVRRTIKTRWLYGLLGVTGIGVLIATVLAAWLFSARHNALTHLLASRAALAATGSDASLPASILLAGESLKRQPSTETRVLIASGLGLLGVQTPKQIPAANVKKAVFADDGAAIVTLGAAGLELWEVATASRRARIPAEVTTFDVSGDTLVTADPRNQIQLWSLANPSAPSATVTCDAPVTAVQVGGPTVAALCGGRPELWKSGARGALTRLRPPRLGVSDEPRWELLALGQSGNFVAVGQVRQSADDDSLLLSTGDDDIPLGPSDFGFAKVGDAALVNETISGNVTAIQVFDDDSGTVVVGSNTGDIEYWDYRTASAGRAADMSPSRDHRLRTSSPVTALDSSTSLVVSGGRNGVARVWSSTDEERGRIVEPTAIVSVSTDGDFLATVTSAGQLRTWEFGDAEHRYLRGLNSRFSVDGRLFFAMRGSDTTVFDIDADQAVGKFSHLSVLSYSLDRSLVAQRSGGSREATLSVARAQGAKIGSSAWNRPVSANRLGSTVVFSPDSQRLAGFYLAAPSSLHHTETNTPGIRIWNAATGEQEVAWRDPRDSSRTAPIFAFSPDSKDLLVTSRSGVVDLPVPHGDPKVLLTGLGGAVTGLVFSPDGRSLATAEIPLGQTASAATDSPEEFTLRIWDYPSMRLGRKFVLPGRSRYLRFSRDSRMLAAASAATITVFDLAAEVVLAQFKLRYPAFGVTFTADGDLFAADRSGLTRFALAPERILQQVCDPKRISENLSAEEWDRYVPKESYIQVCPNLPVPRRRPTPTPR
jgi:WD40 repeat protein